MASTLVRMEQEAMARAEAQEAQILRDDLIDDEAVSLTHAAEARPSGQWGDLLSPLGKVLMSLRDRLTHAGVQGR